MLRDLLSPLISATALTNYDLYLLNNFHLEFPAMFSQIRPIIS